MAVAKDWRKNLLGGIIYAAQNSFLYGTGSPVNIPAVQDQQHKSLVVFCQLA